MPVRINHFKFAVFDEILSIGFKLCEGGKGSKGKDTNDARDVMDFHK
jgi:hypothetical protein